MNGPDSLLGPRVLVVGVLVMVVLVALSVPYGGSVLSPMTDTDGQDGFEPPAPEAMPGDLSVPNDSFAQFENVAPEVGPNYRTVPSVQQFVSTHGSYVIDMNNNGYEDLLLIGGEQPVLFKNTGDGYERHQTFDRPEVSAAHVLDYDNDGSREIALLSSGASIAFYDNSGGEFVRETVQGQLNGLPTSVTSADFTGNGCLDLYVGVYFGSGSTGVPGQMLLEAAQRHPEFRPETDRGAQNILYRGNCEGGFEEITDAAGVGGSAFTLAVSGVDLTGDGHPDIHVGNDFTGDHIYENQGDGTFERRDLGPASDRNAMSSTAVDVTGNHRLDLFVTNVYFENPGNTTSLVPVTRTPLPYGNNLFANQGNGEFRDIAPEHGLNRGGWGWGSTVADYNNDGHLDVIHASTYTSPGVVDDQPSVFFPPQVWTGTTDSWQKLNGSSVGFRGHNARGLVRVDYQNDGALDLVVVDSRTQADVPGGVPATNRTFLYENQHDGGESLQLWVRNPDGLERNAEVYVETDRRTVYRVANARSDLLGQDSRLVHVGTANEAVERVAVVWPDGTTTTYDDLSEGNRYILTPNRAETVDRDF